MTPASAVRAEIAKKSFAEFGAERLSALCDAVGVGGESGVLLDAFRLLVEPWGRRTIGERPLYPSNVADDEAPFEFSVAFSRGAPELQVYVDPQGENPGARSNLEAGRALLEVAASELGARLERLRLIEELFLPEWAKAPFGLWLGASWKPGSELRIKAYLNPQVRGMESAAELMRMAMQRLGFEKAWSVVERALSTRVEQKDEIGIVGLDLSDSADTRLKVYVRHHRATVRDIERMASLCKDYEAGDLRRFYAALGRSEGPFLKKPAATVLTFRDTRSGRPDSVSLEFPIRSYVNSDEAARERVVACLTAFDLAPTAYDKAIRAFATRPLAAGNGLHAHVTHRRLASKSRDAGSPRIGVYLASEAYVNRARQEDEA